jgi:hypothetical protein
VIGSDIDEAGGNAAVPVGLPADTSLRHIPLACGEELLLLVVRFENDSDGQSTEEGGLLTQTVSTWVAAAPQPRGGPLPVVTVPLYGCHVALTPGRAAVAGPPARLEVLAAAVIEFANREAELRQLERRCTDLLESLDEDASHAFEFDTQSLGHRDVLAARFREAVAVRVRLALVAPTVHAPAAHPPTLASQLGERLRDRTRLAERHEFAVDRAELAERLYEACGQRATDFGIARRQMGLEWAIVVLLVIQTVLLIIDLFTRMGAT